MPASHVDPGLTSVRWCVSHWDGVLAKNKETKQAFARSVPFPVSMSGVTRSS